MTPQNENDELLAKIAQQAHRIQELEEQRIRYGPICLNCGKDAPCMTEADANQHGGSVPCTFDPAPKELWQRCQRLTHEVARLTLARDEAMTERKMHESQHALLFQENVRLRRQLAAMAAERDEAEMRNENYRMTLNTRDEQLAAAQVRAKELEGEP